jgi:hypothetical protein
MQLFKHRELASEMRFSTTTMMTFGLTAMLILLGGRTTPTQLKLVPSGRIYWAQGQLTRHLMSRVSISETVEGRWFDLVAIYGGLMWLC